MQSNESIKLLVNEEILHTFKKGGPILALIGFYGILSLIAIPVSLFMISKDGYGPLLGSLGGFTICFYTIHRITKFIGYVTNIRVVCYDGFDNIQSINIDSIESITTSGFGSKVKITGKSGASIILGGIDGVQEIERIVREQQSKYLP